LGGHKGSSMIGPDHGAKKKKYKNTKTRGKAS
jgi:hypothetical protein